LKILHVNHLLDPITGGGTAERTIQLTRFLIKQGAECAVLTLGIGEKIPSESELEGARIFKLTCFNHRYFLYITWPFRVRKLISQFDVVHLMGHWTMLNAAVALSCIHQGKPYVVCPAGALKTFGRSRWLKRAYDSVIGRHIIESASGWIAITEAEKLDFANYGIMPDSVVVIPNGIDPDQYVESANSEAPVLTKLGLTQHDSYLLFLGRLNAIKGPDLLLEAFIQIADKFPELHLVFAGPDSGLMSNLQRFAVKSAAIRRIHFTGYLGGVDKVHALRKALCLVIPSRNEAMSIVVLEAGICGTPVIFTNQCGLDGFADAGAGLMVNVSAESIRDGLIQMLSNLGSLQQSGKRLSEIVREKFLWEFQAKRYYQYYLQLLNKQHIITKTNSH
jgi:glycosyltransferase involved in cell wall biosynthesis